MSEQQVDWRTHGVRVVKKDQMDANTAQTPGMQRLAAITNASANSHKLWAGTVEVEANAKTGAHHHGELESIIYVVSGKAQQALGVAALALQVFDREAIELLLNQALVVEALPEFLPEFPA